MLCQRSRQARGASTLEQVTEPLSPRERRSSCLSEQLRRVHALGKLTGIRGEPRFEQLMQRVKREWEEFEV